MKKIILVLLLAVLVLPVTASGQIYIEESCSYDLPPIASEAGEVHYAPRVITEIVIHHSGSFPYDNSPEANAKAVESYRNYHKYSVHPGVYSDKSTWAWYFDPYLSKYVQMPAQEGYPDGVSGPNGYNYNDIDYHFLVGTDGLIYTGRRIDTVGWHASNWEVNVRSIGVCFIGNFDSTVPNSSQYWAGVDLVSKLMEKYKIYNISRHSDYSAKSCPGYSFPFYQFVKDCRRWAGIYTDVGYDFWAHNAISDLGKMNLIQGYPDGSFKANNSITRAEFIYLIWKLSGSPTVSASPFIDTCEHWAKDAITWASANHLVQGYSNGLFLPDMPITRAEMSKIIFNFKKLYPVVDHVFPDVTNHWAEVFIDSCFASNIIYGYPDGTFKPDNLLTRAEAVQIIERIK